MAWAKQIPAQTRLEQFARAMGYFSETFNTPLTDDKLEGLIQGGGVGIWNQDGRRASGLKASEGSFSKSFYLLGVGFCFWNYPITTHLNCVIG